MFSTTSRAGKRARRVLAGGGLTAVVLAASALAAGVGLTGFLLRSGEQTGYPVTGKRATQNSIEAYVNYGGGSKKQKRAETAELKKAGFLEAADEQLRASHGREAFSLVMEFSSSAGAQTIAAGLLSNAIKLQGKSAKLSRFTIPGVPSAAGVVAKAGRVATANVYWTAGDCAFGSGDYVPKHAGPVSTPVIAGVKALDKRIYDSCP